MIEQIYEYVSDEREMELRRLKRDMKEKQICGSVRRVVYSIVPLSIERRLRNRYDDPKQGVTHTVELQCPHTGDVFATDATSPIRVNEDHSKVGYYCELCDDEHVFFWGTPSPIYVHDNCSY